MWNVVADDTSARIERGWELTVREYDCPQPHCQQPAGRPCRLLDRPWAISVFACTGRYRLALADGVVPPRPGIEPEEDLTGATALEQHTTDPRAD